MCNVNVNERRMPVRLARISCYCHRLRGSGAHIVCSV